MSTLTPGRVVGWMSVADQQLVEIAKAIVGDFHVLIMDEPTSALNLEDTERLFRIVRRLKADGVAILYVSHRLWEVFDLADHVTVFRDGNSSALQPRSSRPISLRSFGQCSGTSVH